jgi:hypothetical protein
MSSNIINNQVDSAIVLVLQSFSLFLEVHNRVWLWCVNRSNSIPYFLLWTVFIDLVSMS